MSEKKSRAIMLEVCRRFKDDHLTIRSAAKKAGVSKSTFHNFIHKELEHTDEQVYDECISCLQVNLADRHIRGGQATKLRWEKIRQERGEKR